MTTAEPTTGEKLEKVAFQFCKISTVAFLCGRYTLPVAATLASVLYFTAYFKGKQDTRCILRYPLLISAFWGVIGAMAWVFTINPALPQSVLKSVGIGK